MINRDSGKITIGAMVIERDLQKTEFMKSKFFQTGRATHSEQGWYFASANPQIEMGSSFAASLVFRGEQLIAIHIACADPRFGNDWNDWSKSLELARKEVHDAIVRRDLGSDVDFGWGRVESVFDEKSGGSMIVVQYAQTASFAEA